MFGGDFYQYFQHTNLVGKFIVKNMVLKSDLLLLETKKLISDFSPMHNNVHWLPNHRKMPKEKIEIMNNPGEKLKVVFISHVRNEKGIFELIKAADELNNVKIDIYGPFYDGLDKKVFNGTKVNYGGVLPSAEVLNKLKQYDALILPSYKEGYPGIVIEALSCGLAILCTNLPSLKEMLDDKTDALMFEPRSSNEIVKAVKYIDENRNELIRLKKRSLVKAQEFNSKTIAEKYLDLCSKLLKKS